MLPHANPARSTRAALAVLLLLLAAVAAAVPYGDDYGLHPRFDGEIELVPPGPEALARGVVEPRFAQRGAHTYAVDDGGLDVYRNDLGRVGGLAGDFRSVAAGSDSCIYVGGHEIVHRIDVSDPANPVIVESLPVPGAGDVERLSVAGNTLLVDGDAGVFRAPLGGPCGPFQSPDAIPGAPAGIVASDIGGGFGAFVTGNTLVTYDLSQTPLVPVTTFLSGTTTDVTVDDGGNVVTVGSYGARAFTILSGGTPVPTGQITDVGPLVKAASTGSPNQFVMTGVNGDVHFTGTGADSVFQRTATVSGVAPALDVSAGGGTAGALYTLNGTTYRVGLYGAGDGGSPMPVQQITDLFVPNDAAVSGTNVIVAHSGNGGGARILDGSDPGNLTTSAEADSLAAVLRMAMFRASSLLRGSRDTEDYALVASLVDFKVLRITDPANPQIVGSIPGVSLEVAAAPDGSVALRADLTPAFRVVDVSDPANPFDRGSVPMPNAVNDMLVDGTWAVVASVGQTGRWDVSDPDAPVLDHATPLAGIRALAALSAADHYLLGSDGAGGRIVCYDFGTRAEVSSVALPANRIVVTDVSGALTSVPEIVYAADFLGGSVFVIDWSDPANPVFVGEYTDPAFRPRGLAINGDTIVVADNLYPGRAVVLPAHESGNPPTAAPIGFVPAGGALLRGFPNPFREATTLELSLGRRTDVRLDVFDVSGRKVRALAARTMPAGRHAVGWDGRDDAGSRVASGVYFVRLAAGERVERRKVTLLR